MNKLKILILSDYGFAKGGAEQVAIASAAGLAKQHEVVFFSAVGPVSEELENSAVSKIICLGQQDILDSKNKLKSMVTGIYNFGAIKALKALLSEWQPDIVHMHGLSKALSWAPVLVFSSFSIPVVYTIHDYGLFCPNMGLYNYRTQKICTYHRKGCWFKCMAANCDKRNYGHKLWRWLRHAVTKKNIKFDRRVDAFIVVSSFLKGFIEKNLYTTKPLRLIYNPLHVNKDTSYGQNREQGKRNGLIRFLYVGRLSPEKGLELLLEAIKEVKAELIIIGEGELMEKCRVASSRTGGRVKVLGYMKRKEVFGFMRESDCLVLPSKCLEPAPLVLAEAGFNGLPCLVADHGGLSEFIREGENGFYFDPDNVGSLIDAMEKIIQDPQVLVPLREKSRKVTQDMKLDSSYHIAELLKFYGQMVHERQEAES